MFDFLEDIEINWTAAIITLVLSAAWWWVMFFIPAWKESTAFPLNTRIIMSIILPIIAYPLVLMQLNK